MAPIPRSMFLVLFFATTVGVGSSAVTLSPELGGDTTRRLRTQEAFTFVAANANADTREAFKTGNTLFNQRWLPAGDESEAVGLGPLFNARSCADCHVNNGRGFPPARPDEAPESMLLRISVVGMDDQWVPSTHYGDQIQDRAVEGVVPEATVRVHWKHKKGSYGDGEAYELRWPVVNVSDLGYGALPKDTVISMRVANPLIGLGLLEMIPEQVLFDLADPDDSDNDGISGRVNLVFNPRDGDTAVGRFGWKANSPNLTSQNAAAAFGDIGLTSPIFPTERCIARQRGETAADRKARHKESDGGSGARDCGSDESPMEPELSKADLRALNVYTRRIAVPKQRGATRPNVKRGYQAFLDAGCQGCHRVTLTTGQDERAPDLSGQTIHPFTDLLLHDMGDGLADGRPDFLASGREWRTAPLWGIGLTEVVSGQASFLHDGRARTLAEAILWHDGEAWFARERFRLSDKDTRDDLVAFLRSL